MRPSPAGGHRSESFFFGTRRMLAVLYDAFPRPHRRPARGHPRRGRLACAQSYCASHWKRCAGAADSPLPTKLALCSADR